LLEHKTQWKVHADSPTGSAPRMILDSAIKRALAHSKYVVPQGPATQPATSGPHYLRVYREKGAIVVDMEDGNEVVVRPDPEKLKSFGVEDIDAFVQSLQQKLRIRRAGDIGNWLVGLRRKLVTRLSDIATIELRKAQPTTQPAPDGASTQPGSALQMRMQIHKDSFLPDEDIRAVTTFFINRKIAKPQPGDAFNVKGFIYFKVKDSAGAPCEEVHVRPRRSWAGMTKVAGDRPYENRSNIRGLSRTSAPGVYTVTAHYQDFDT
ncbi:unnamed protein product, partial [marine sediment metagenome]